MQAGPYLKVLAGLLEDKRRRWETCDDALLLEEVSVCVCVRERVRIL